jgi:hypothetical protein
LIPQKYLEKKKKTLERSRVEGKEEGSGRKDLDVFPLTQEGNHTTQKYQTNTTSMRKEHTTMCTLKSTPTT